VLTVEKAQVQGVYNKNISNTGNIASLTSGERVVASRGGTQVMPVVSGQQQVVPATPVQQQVTREPVEPPARVYKIGDTGPAGGLIFFDKGDNSGGWRYLEAAPATAEVAAQWSHNGGALGGIALRAMGGTPREVGTGQTNTQNIMRFFNQNGGGFGLAIQVCDELVINGFDDWFLPSLDELSFMYGNLHRRGLGGFRNEWYYSSSIRNMGTAGLHWGLQVNVINFANGEPSDRGSTEMLRVRAARRF
jgi:hypothetical protein